MISKKYMRSFTYSTMERIFWGCVLSHKPKKKILINEHRHIDENKHMHICIQNPPINAWDIRNMGLIPGLGRHPGEGNGNSFQYSCLVGCSPWGRKESDTTEWLHFHFSLSFIGEGNGSPLQCSCLENPRDGGAW